MLQQYSDTDSDAPSTTGTVGACMKDTGGGGGATHREHSGILCNSQAVHKDGEEPLTIGTVHTGRTYITRFPMECTQTDMDKS